MAALRSLGVLFFLIIVVELNETNLTTESFFSNDYIDLINNTFPEENGSHESDSNINIHNSNLTRNKTFLGQDMEGHRFNRTTESFLDQAQHSEIRNKTKKGNGSRKQNKRKFVHGNFTELVNSVNHSVTNSGDNFYTTKKSKKSGKKRFVSTTIQSNNFTTPESDNFQWHQKFQNNHSLVEVSSVRYNEEDIFPIKDNENETTSHKPQYSQMSGNENEMKNESTIIAPTRTSIDPEATIEKTTLETHSQEAYSQLDGNVINYSTVTPHPIFSTSFNISLSDLVGSSRTTASISHPLHDTTTQTTKIESVTKYPTTINNTITHSKHRKQDLANVMQEFSKEEEELESNESRIPETTTNKFTYVLPELDNVTNFWQTPFDFEAIDKKLPLNHTGGSNAQHKTPVEHEIQTQSAELTSTASGVNYSECNNILCVNDQITSEPPHEHNSATHIVLESGKQLASIKTEDITMAISDTNKTVESMIPSTEKNEHLYIKTESFQESESTTETEVIHQKSQNVFLMIPWKSLTREILKNRCVTVEFLTEKTSDEWLSTNEVKFRRLISDIVRGNIVYISPTPIRVSQDLLVTFVIEPRVHGNETYVTALNISQELNNHQEKLQKSMDTTITKIYVGFPDVLKKIEDCQHHGVIHTMITTFLTSIVIIIMFIVVYVSSQYLSGWSAKFTPKGQENEDSTNLTEQVELSHMGRYKRTENTNRESYASREEVTESDNRRHDRPSTSHNSVCTLEL